jgi:hypothetical protein
MMRSIKSTAARQEKALSAQQDAKQRRSKRALSSISAFSAAIMVVIGIVLAVAPGANAIAFPYGVYAPNKISATQAQGWANLSRDCSDTYGCFNYIQIQVLRWDGPQYVNGWWADNNGWNSITANLLPGCYDYRTRTDSYNYAVGDVGGGANAGPVGVTANGQTIYEWHLEWNSGWARICD